MIDIDGIDIGDAAIFGGIVGFVEESARLEDDIDIDDDFLKNNIETYIESSTDHTMRLLYNQNPGLVRHIIHEAYKSRKRISPDLKNEIESISSEMEEEIEYLDKQENKNDV